METLKSVMEIQCKQDQMEREVLEAWINDLSEMNLCDYCDRDSTSMETCRDTFKWNSKPLEK